MYRLFRMNLAGSRRPYNHPIDFGMREVRRVTRKHTYIRIDGDVKVVKGRMYISPEE